MFGWFGKKKAAPPRPPSPPLALSDTPDTPVGFGYKTTWLAVRGSAADVVAVLGLIDPRPANWDTGVQAAYGAGQHYLDRPLIFVTPQVGEWTFAVSSGLPELDMRITPEDDADYTLRGERHDRFRAMIDALSARFGEIQYFGTHRVVEYHAWALVRDGVVVRMFSYLGEIGEVTANIGRQTPEEAELGFPDFSGLSRAEATELTFESDDGMPAEDWVARIAAAWSLDPNTLDDLDLAPGVGIVGLLPDRFWSNPRS